MKSWNKPTPEQVNQAVALLVHAQQYLYFFDRLENPEWLEPLRQKDFFRHPPAPIRDEEEGTIRFPSWPEARYLARMASHKPDLVAEIVQGMNNTDNHAVISDLIDALLAMPSDVSIRLVKKVANWAKYQRLYLLVPEKLGQLVVHWARAGKTKEALDVARVLLDFLPEEQHAGTGLDEEYYPPPEPRARFYHWQYEEILKKHYPELVRAAGLCALELLCDKLEKAIKLSHPRKDDQGPEDYSHLWRPAIEDHPQNLGHTINDALITAVRNAAEFVVSSRQRTVKEVVSALENRRWKVFRRIALHVLRVFANQCLSLIAARLTDRQLFDDVGVRHEYSLLMQAYFSCIAERDQSKIIGWIEAGPDIERFKERRQAKDSYPPFDEELTRYHEVWQRDWLARIGLENLPGDWQERYRTLAEQYNKPEHPEFPVYMEVGEIQPTSPKTAEDLKAMSIQEIVDFLNTWTAPESFFDEPSRQGLGQALLSVVADEPQRFAEGAVMFQGLDSTYVRAFLSGLQESLKHQRTFDWGPVLDLCEWMLAQPREIEQQQAGRLEADPDWGWTRRMIADLLSSGFEDGVGSIPINLRTKVWGILKPLTEDPDPTPEREERYGGSNMDPATLCINTIRGQAMDAVVRYALWVQRHTKGKVDTKDQPCKGFDEMPEVREVLEAHLDVAQEPSRAIRTVYGRWFPWLVLLDSEWAGENTSKIFPLGKGEETLFEAAWNTYITLRRPYNNVFGLLCKQYLHSVERIGCRHDDTRWLANPDEMLAEHLMTYYWRGKISLDDPLLITFWEKAPNAIRAYALKFLGQALKQTEEDIPAEILDRLKQLWEMRLTAAKQAQQRSDFDKEIAAFGWWFVSEKFDIAWVIAQLLESLQLVHRTDPDHTVLEHLAKAVKTDPAKSVQCLRIIAEGDREGWKLYARRDHIQRILEVALQNPTARQEAEQVIHYLGRRGFLEFRYLLEG